MRDLEPTDPKEQKVWELLKKAPPAKPGPFFARNVLREVRAIDSRSSVWAKLADAFTMPRLAFAATAAVVALAAVFAMQNGTPGANSEPIVVEADSTEFDPASEIVSVEFFGNLVAVADPGQLDDAALAELFF